MQKMELLTGKLVLIDTWWNVNSRIETVQNLVCNGFNRYMVECEFARDSKLKQAIDGFNRYMVECD